MEEIDRINLSRQCWKTAGDAKDVREMRAANSTNIFQLRIRRVVFLHKSA